MNGITFKIALINGQSLSKGRFPCVSFILMFQRTTFYDLSLKPGGYLILFVQLHLGGFLMQELDPILTRRTPGGSGNEPFELVGSK